jgi:hypothetical protein
VFIDLFPPISVSIILRVAVALFVLLFVGFSIGEIFEIEMNEKIEVVGIPLILAIKFLHLLAYGVFLTRSNIVLYGVVLGSFFI